MTLIEVSNCIKEDAAIAVHDGYEVKGYLGVSLKYLSREDLEGMLHILFQKSEVLAKIIQDENLSIITKK